MDKIDVKTKDELSNFLSKQPSSQFLQAWQWGEFHQNLGSKVRRLVVKKGDNILAAASLIKKSLPMGKSYFYCPRGPIIDFRLPIELLFDEIKELAKKENVMFMRFEPQAEVKSNKFRIIKTLDIQPSQTVILDLKNREDELLNAMHQKTRYNIRLAEKKGVEIVSASLDNFDDFWKLMGETKERDNFRLHGIDYYQEMLKLDNNFIKLFFAKYQNKNIATAIVSWFGDTVTYMHGASSDSNRNVMASYLLQWEIAREAKAKGFKHYDFYGIDGQKWPGVTRFKKGFSGKEVNYPGTFDLVFDSGWYNVYKMIRKVRRTF